MVGSLVQKSLKAQPWVSDSRSCGLLLEWVVRGWGFSKHFFHGFLSANGVLGVKKCIALGKINGAFDLNFNLNLSLKNGSRLEMLIGPFFWIITQGPFV